MLDNRTDPFPAPTPALDLDVAAVEHGETVTLSLAGELDIAGQPIVQQAVDAAFGRQPRRVVLDFSRLRFMDSAGIHVTLAARGLAAEGPTELVLVPGPPAVQRVFALARAVHPSCVFSWAEPSI